MCPQVMRGDLDVPSLGHLDGHFLSTQIYHDRCRSLAKFAWMLFYLELFLRIINSNI